MTYSLNEVEAMAKKAVRGAGYHWGVAEDSAKAVRWLCSQGADGCAALADWLTERERRINAGAAPSRPDLSWTSGRGGLCPIQSGIVLSDTIASLPTDGVRIQPLLKPILLVGFAGVAALHSRRPLCIAWPGMIFETDGASLVLKGDRALVLHKEADCVSIHPLNTPVEKTNRFARVNTSALHWGHLNHFAQRTYAPATEESRRLGAGDEGSNPQEKMGVA